MQSTCKHTLMCIIGGVALQETITKTFYISSFTSHPFRANICAKWLTTSALSQLDVGKSLIFNGNTEEGDQNDYHHSEGFLEYLNQN